MVNAAVFSTLGAELKNLRKSEAVFEHFHFTNNANYSKRLVADVYNTDDVYQEVANNLDSNTYEKSVTPQMQNLLSSLRTIFEQGWFPVLDSYINTNPDDKLAGAIQYDYDPDLTDGTQEILNRRGRWGALRKKMEADLQVIVGNGIAFGSLTPNSSNTGSISLVGIYGEDHCLSGELTIICTDDTVDAQQFSLQNVMTKKLADPQVPTSQDGLFSILQSDNPLVLNRALQDGTLGLRIQVNRVAVSVTDPNNLFQGFIPVVTNVSDADTNRGKMYFRVRRRAADPIWGVSWYRDAAHTFLIATANATSIDGTLQFEAGGGTSLSWELNLVNAAAFLPAAGDYDALIVVDLLLPRKGDQWTIAVTNDEGGQFATKIAHNYRASLNSGEANSLTPLVATLLVTGTGGVDNGPHSYKYTFVRNGRESLANSVSNIVTTDGTHKQTAITGVLAGPSGTTSRNVYRTKIGDPARWYFMNTIADNVTTAFTDDYSDSNLTRELPTTILDSQAASVSMT